MLDVRVDESLPLLIFDGDCAFCSSAVRFVEGKIRLHPRCEPWQRLDLDALGISQAECEKALQYVDAEGRMFAAERALARVLVDAGRGWRLLGAAMLVPGVRHVSGIAYRWVARNRHRMPGGTAQCALPQEQRGAGSRNGEEERASTLGNRLSPRTSEREES